MHQFVTPQICARRTAAGQSATGTNAVVFEAPSLPALATSIAEWVAEHPESAILSLSHARETRLEDRASLGGPARVPVYTGLLLVSTVAHEGVGAEEWSGPTTHEADTAPERSIARDLVAAGK